MFLIRAGGEFRFVPGDSVEKGSHRGLEQVLNGGAPRSIATVGRSDEKSLVGFLLNGIPPPSGNCKVMKLNDLLR
jgi:hypothetical protein